MNSRALARRHTWTTALALMALLAAGLSGCGFSKNPYADVPQLEVAWNVPWDGDHPSFRGKTSTEDRWITFDEGASQLLALDLADGSKAWALPMREVCEFSEVNDDGLLAVRSGTKGACNTVDLIDTKAGKKLWSAPLGGARYSSATSGQVGLSGQTVSAVGACGVERWEARSGKKLSSIEATRKFPDHPTCRDALTSTRLAVVAEEKALVGYDVDTGKARWTQKAGESRLGGLFPADPLVVAIEADGVAGHRAVDPDTGELGPIIGRPGSAPGYRLVRSVDDRVVGAYNGSASSDPDGTYGGAIRVWDPATGAEQASWPGQPGTDFLGVGADGIFTGIGVPGGGDGAAGAYWLARAGWSGRAERTLGWIDDYLVSPTLVGDLLIDSGYGERTDGSHGQRIVAYKVPKKTTSDPIPRSAEAGREKWVKGDVRPDPSTDPCAEVSDETLRGLGFESLLDRQVPLDCSWTVGSAVLTVDVEVVRPGPEHGATSSAKRAMEQRRDMAESLVEVEGLGDEAWAGLSARVAAGPDEPYNLDDPALTDTDVVVFARQKNVLARVQVTDRPDRDGKLPPAAGSREASALAVLGDVVDAAGGRLGVRKAAEDGPVTQLPDMCGAVAADVRKVLPGAKATDLTAAGEDRLRGCLWETRRSGHVDSHVQVVAYAVAASPITGTTGPVAAEKIFADSRGGLATPRPEKKWDESALAEDFEADYFDASYYLVRSDNVILAVSIGLRDREKSTASRAAQRIADQAMKAVRR